MTGTDFYWSGWGHVPIPEPMTVAIEMECPDWLGPIMCPPLNLGNRSVPLSLQVRRVKGLRKTRILPKERMDNGGARI